MCLTPGAAIGTGLFYQSGKVLYFAGPIPTCLGYLLMGTVVYAVLVRLGKTKTDVDFLRRSGVVPPSAWWLHRCGESHFHPSFCTNLI